MDISQIAKASLPPNAGGGGQVAAQAQVQPQPQAKAAQTPPAAQAASAATVIATAQAEQQANANKPDANDVQAAVEKINRVVESIPSNLEFTTDQDTNMNVVKVVDKESGEVIRQFPSEEVIAIAKALENLQGLMVSEKA